MKQVQIKVDYQGGQAKNLEEWFRVKFYENEWMIETVCLFEGQTILLERCVQRNHSAAYWTDKTFYELEVSEFTAYLNQANKNGYLSPEEKEIFLEKSRHFFTQSEETIMQFEEKTISRKEIFDGHIFKVVVDEVELPNGLGTAQRELVFHPGAVAVLAITPEDKVVLVKQYRKAIEEISYELPAGKLEVGEAGSEEAAALRELEEETGYTGELKFMYEFYTAIGFCDEKIKLYKATHLRKVANPRPKDADETIELLEVTFEEWMALFREGKIKDAKTLIALQHYALHRGGR